MSHLVNIRESARFPRAVRLREDDSDQEDGRKLLAKGIAALLASGNADDHALGLKVSKLLKPADEDEDDEDDEDVMDGGPPGIQLESRAQRVGRLRGGSAFNGVTGITEGGRKRGTNADEARRQRAARLRGR